MLCSGCYAASDATTRPPSDDLFVVASTSIVADLASTVVAEVGEVVSLVPVGGDPHVHEPTPGDVRLLTRADLVLHNGAGLEPWLAPLLTHSAADEIDLASSLPSGRIALRDGQPDPHLWMAPPYAAAYVDAIAEEVARLRPDAATRIRTAAEAVTRELAELDNVLQRELDAIPPERRKLVTSHDAYGYFGEHYGLEVIGSVVGLSTEEEPSAARLGQLVEAIRREGVPTVFVETTINPDLITSVAREAAVEVGAPLYGDSLGPPGSGAETYAGMMRHNVSALVAGLGR